MLLSRNFIGADMYRSDAGKTSALWPQDRRGRLLNAAAPSTAFAIRERIILDEACDLALARFPDSLHSVYLSGPHARTEEGEAIILVVLRLCDTTSESTADWEALATSRMRALTARPFRFRVLRWREIFDLEGRFSRARFQLATNAVCLAGRDLTKLMAPPRISDGLVNAFVCDAAQRLETAITRLSVMEDGARADALIRRASRNAIQSAFALVAQREAVWVEAPKLALDFFRLTHRAPARVLDTLIPFATGAAHDRATAVAVLSVALRHMAPRWRAWLDARNPSRAEALPMD